MAKPGAMPPPLARRLVFGDLEQIQALRALPRIIDPGTWTGRRVKFRAEYWRRDDADLDDLQGVEICEEIEAGRATVIEDRSLDPHDGRVLVKTAAGEMWCHPNDLQEVPDAQNQGPDGGMLGVAPVTAPRRAYRVAVEFTGSKEYIVEARTRDAARAKARALALDDEPDEWEPTDEVEVHEA